MKSKASPPAVDKEVNEQTPPRKKSLQSPLRKEASAAVPERARSTATPTEGTNPPASAEAPESGTRAAPGKEQEPGSRSRPHEIETAADHKQVGGRVDRKPSEAKKAAGNYKKEHVRFEGLDITIETPAGARRSGKGADDKKWSVRMPAAYGYIKRSTGADDDQVDVLLAKGEPNGKAFIVDQYEPQSGKFDEHKVVLAVETPEDAVRLYQASFSGDASRHRMGAVTELSVADLKTWLAQGARKEPFFSGGGDLPEQLAHEGHGQAWVGRETFSAARKQVARSGSPKEKALFENVDRRIAEIGRRRNEIASSSASPEEKASKIATLHKREIATMMQAAKQTSRPSVKGARRAPDGHWYVEDPARAGKYLQILPHG